MAMGMVRAVLFAAALLLCAGAPASAEDAKPEAFAIELKGAAVKAQTLTPEALATFPRTEREVSFKTSKGEVKGRYAGVLLWPILEKAGLLEGEGHNKELTRTFIVSGKDGYAIAFSVGEIAPDFGATPIMIATSLDGRPLDADEGPRLIVPGDTRGARNVRDVAAIELR